MHTGITQTVLASSVRTRCCDCIDKLFSVTSSMDLEAERLAALRRIRSGNFDNSADDSLTSSQSGMAQPEKDCESNVAP